MTGQMAVPKQTKRVYSISSLGRDLFYALYSNYLLVFLTDAIGVTKGELIAVGIIIALARIWDAINDTFMGIIIDNTNSRFGKFKPWILIGALSSGLVMFALFQDYHFDGNNSVLFIVIFAVIYILAGMTYTMNDIAYWSMYPSFTSEPKEREKIGAFARMFASIGMFITIAVVPLIYPNFAGGPKKAFFWIALVASIVFIVSQIIVFFFVKQPKNKISQVKQEKTKFKDLLHIIFKNDQLVVIIVTILLFNTGYFITTALGIYFFNYDFNKYGGNEFTIFSIVLAISQLAAILAFPKLVRIFGRKKLFTYSIILMIIGYLLFFGTGYFFIPENMLVIGIAGFFLFFGQGFIQVLVLVMLADTIEYGQWKLGTRNEAVVFSINPFVTKMATAFQSLVVAITLALSGLNDKVINVVTNLKNENPLISDEEIRTIIANSTTEGMLLQLRLSMIVIPLILIIISYVIYMKKYKIDSALYEKIMKDLNEKIDTNTGGNLSA